MLRRINNVQVGGVTGTKTKLTMMGKWKNPVIPNSASLPSLYIPNSPYVIVSVSQLLQELQGHAYLTWKKAYIWNATGVVASATVKDGLYIQDDVRPDMTLGDLLEFMESATTGREEEPLTVATFHQSLHHLKQLHDSYNHESYAKIRAIHGFPPASTESPDPVCGACQTAGTRRPNITQSSKEEPTRPWQTLCMDISRKMPADKRGNQRFLMVQDMFTDHWTALLMKRKSDATKVVEEMILQINNKYLPHRVSMIHCDMDTCFVTDSRFREMLASYGVQLRPSPPNDQAKNPAENVMKRAQRQMQATMARSNMPKGSWSYALLHVCYVHSVTPRLNRASPQEEATGIKPAGNPPKCLGPSALLAFTTRASCGPLRWSVCTWEETTSATQTLSDRITTSWLQEPNATPRLLNMSRKSFHTSTQQSLAPATTPANGLTLIPRVTPTVTTQTQTENRLP